MDSEDELPSVLGFAPPVPPPPAPPAPLVSDAAVAEEEPKVKRMNPQTSPKVPLPPSLLPYKSFDCANFEEMEKSLKEHGVAVMPNVLNSEEVREMQCGMWEYLEMVTEGIPSPAQRINRDDPSTWPKSIKFLTLLRNMLIQYARSGQSPVAWMGRQNPKVAKVFAQIWKCAVEDLWSSVDGMSINLPPEILNAERAKVSPNTRASAGFHASDWFHRDQRMTEPEFQCIQGFINCFDVHEGSATLAIYPGSHTLTSELSACMDPKAAESTNDFVTMNVEQLQVLEQRCQRYNVLCKAGSLVLWDSRLIHCGSLPQQGRPMQDIRFVVYVCMMPRQKFKISQAEPRKVKIMQEQRLSSHWPDARKKFSVTGPHFGPADPIQVFLAQKKLPPPLLTPLGFQLAGFPRSIANTASSVQDAVEKYARHISPAGKTAASGSKGKNMIEKMLATARQRAKNLK